MEPVITPSSSPPQFTRQKLCEFNCSWMVCDTASIDDIVSYRTEGLSSDTRIEAGGISLKLPDESVCSGNHCVLSISCKCPLQMKVDAIDILASARHMELSLSSGEYLTTSQGFRVDEELGCRDRLYALQYSFENPVSRFTVKFVSLEVPTELWLHSIHITMSMTNTSNYTPMPGPHLTSLFGDLVLPKVDMEKVTTMLSEMGKQLTPQAEDLMQSIRSKQAERSQNVGNMPAMLISMLSQVKNQSVESTASAVPCGSIPASQRDLLSLFSSDLSQNIVSLGHSFQKPDFTEIPSQKSNCSIENSSACGTVESSKRGPFDKTIDHSDCTSVKEVPTKCFCPTSDSSDVKLERCNLCNAPLSLLCLEQRLVLAVEETEKRLKKHLTDSIDDLERRFSARLDKLLLCLHPNTASNNDRLLPGQEPGLD